MRANATGAATTARVGALVVFVALAVVAPLRSSAETPPPMVVGIYDAPPFSFKAADGEWQGIAVHLLQHLRVDLARQVTFEEVAPAEVADALAQRRIDVALVVSPTPDGERAMDFSQPYYSTRVGIAVAANPSATDWSAVFEQLFSWAFLKIILSLLAFLLVAAVAMWLCERGANDEHFRKNGWGGIADGLWWAAVTMTTVGYGDKTAKTQLGRAVAGVWMFTAVVAISLFTAQVASLLTMRSLSGRVRGPADLSSVQVGALAGSATQAELRRWLGVSARGYDRYEQGFEALLRAEIDAFVAADPVLRYEATNRFPGRISVLRTDFGHQDFALALPTGSPDRKPINEAVLRLRDSADWAAVLREYLGDDR